MADPFGELFGDTDDSILALHPLAEILELHGHRGILPDRSPCGFDHHVAQERVLPFRNTVAFDGVIGGAC